MEDDGRNGLSFGEQCKVVAVSGGFVVVLCGLCALVITQDGLPVILGTISNEFRNGRWFKGLGLSFSVVMGIGFYLGGIIFGLMGVYQGSQARRTPLTTWILQESDEEVHRKRHAEFQESAEFQSMSSKDKALNAYVPSKVGCWILAAMVLGFAVVVVINAFEALTDRVG
jgi:hypothetical protein